MAESSDPAVLYVAIYGDLDSATADLDAFEQLRKAEVIGTYDAAIIGAVTRANKTVKHDLNVAAELEEELLEAVRK